MAALEAAERTDDDGRFGYPSGPKNMVPAKSMVPAKPGKMEEWKRRRVDLEDYAEASLQLLKEALKLVRAQNVDYDEH